MRIHFELYASLMQYLPTNADRHRVTLDAPDGITPHQVLDRFGVPRKDAKLIVLNGVFVAGSERDSVQLREDDVLAVWPPVAGG